MKRTKVAALATALVIGVGTVAGATSASADFTPQTRDIVGVGSDTSQFAVNYLADGVLVGGSLKVGYNGAASARLVSFDAMTTAGVVHDNIVLKTGKPAVQRPNGSGEGKTALLNNADVNFARASSSLNATEISGGLSQVPFALDGLKLAVSAQGSNAPTTITAAQMVAIYDGTYTNWSQVDPTKSGTIVAYIPQSGSGTRSFFVAQLQAANGGVAVTLRSDIKTSEEHDAKIFDHANADATIAANAVNAVAPFSTGRASFSPTLVSLESGFSAQRALYNVVRTADLTKPWFTTIFSATGFVCGTTGKSAIEAAGFKQLALPDDGGVCGTPTTAATTNFAVN